MSGLTMPTHVEYHYHYNGPYNNYGQNATGEGTINNINTPPSQSTVTDPQGSDRPGMLPSCYPIQKLSVELKSSPETTIRCPPVVRPEDQPTTIHADRKAQSEGKSSPKITILPANQKINQQNSRNLQRRMTLLLQVKPTIPMRESDL